MSTPTGRKILTLPKKVNTLQCHGPKGMHTFRLRGRGLQKRNAAWLARHPLCVSCERKGDIREAAEVDHIIPLHLGGRDDESNLQGLCIDCHKEKTSTEAEGRRSA
jgi:5-methylcytosine-specific restriction protein A